MKNHCLVAKSLMSLLLAFSLALVGAAPLAAYATDDISPTSHALQMAGVSFDGSSPATSNASVTVHADKPSAMAIGHGQSVTIALQGAAATGSRSHGATRIYENTLPGTSTAVQEMGGAVRFLTVLQRPSASGIQRYAIGLPDGAQLAAVPDGGLLILGPESVLGRIEAPWAKDATGRHLPTSYQVEGTTLVQRTDTSHATYPVVIDPKISFGWYIYIRFNPSERREIAQAMAQAGGGVAGAALCSGGSPVAMAVCTGAGVAVATVAFEFLYDNRWNRPECGLEVRVTYSSMFAGSRLIQGDSSSDC